MIPVNVQALMETICSLEAVLTDIKKLLERDSKLLPFL